MSSNFLFENRAVYEIMWKYFVEQGRPKMTILRVYIACWITKATNTHLEYVIHVAFPPQQWLHERPSMLRYTYIACLVCILLTPSIFLHSEHQPTKELNKIQQNTNHKTQFVTSIKLLHVSAPEYHFLCFVDRASLYNLANKSN